MPARRKPVAQLQDRRSKRMEGRVIALPERASIERPDPPEGLAPETELAWNRFWDSDLARVVQPPDLPRLLRWVQQLDQYERAMTVVEQALVVKGSTGQIRVNPLALHALRLEESIAKTEAEFGMTPMARARLGLTVGQAELTVEQINRLARDRRRTSIKKEIRDGFEEA